MKGPLRWTLTVLSLVSLAVGPALNAAGLVQSSGGSQAPAPPVPRPFPGSVTPPPRTADPTPVASTPMPAVPAPVAEAPRTSPSDQALAGTPVYPTAEFIDAYDAGSGQRYYIYGTNASYADIVAYYKNVLKNAGRELYKTPPMQQFDLGRYQEETMAYPPSVVVKDYTWNGAAGYLVVTGTTEKRFKTVIQIVPATAIK